MKPNIDYKETMHNFLRHNINVLRNALQGPIPGIFIFFLIRFLCKKYLNIFEFKKKCI